MKTDTNLDNVGDSPFRVVMSRVFNKVQLGRFHCRYYEDSVYYSHIFELREDVNKRLDIIKSQYAGVALKANLRDLWYLFRVAYKLDKSGANVAVIISPDTNGLHVFDWRP